MDEPVDFHQMDVSKADRKVIYGVYGDLQRGTDEGRTWTRVGRPAPAGIIVLAASSENPDILYAGTQNGLQRTANGGQSWKVESDRTTMVHVTRNGTNYAFVGGLGLMRATEKDLKWQTLGKGLGEAGRERLYAIAAPPHTCL